MASELSAHIVKRAEGGEVVLPETTKAALERAQALDEDALRQVGTKQASLLLPATAIRPSLHVY